MWVHNGIFYRVSKVELDYMSNQMAIHYIGYTNETLKNPIKMHTYLKPLGEFKYETEVEEIVYMHQKEQEKT